MHRGRCSNLVLLVALFALGCGKSAPPPANPRPEAEASPAAVAADHGLAGCAAGEVKACDALIELWGSREMLPEGKGEAGKAAAAVLHKACDEANISSACMGLALMYKYGTATGGSKDKETSNKYWARIAELGDLNSFRDGEPTEAGLKALQLATDECAAGRSRACLQLGWATYGGVQREADPATAFTPYARACALGSGQGCRWAGHLARVYKTAPLTRAQELLMRGCEELESQAACAELGHFLDLIRNDMAAATPLLEGACRDGHRVGCMHLAEALVRSKGEPAMIAENFLMACDAGAKPACVALVQHARADCTLELAVDAELGARCIAAGKAFCAGGKDIDKVASECAQLLQCP